MKSKLYGMLFLLSALMCGGGIDSNNMNQFWIGAVMGIVFGVLVVVETNEIQIKKTRSNNDHSRVAYLK